jgi:glycerophosphoryl diester phosphodiesterase
MKTLILPMLGIAMMMCITACSGEKNEMEEEELLPSLRLGFMSPTKVIAHRGYWNTQGSAENSLAALEKAAEAGFYGSEFDVRLSLDGVPVICHEETVNGLLIESTLHGRLMSMKLSNGETLPTLQQYLSRGKNLDIQLILEIKMHKRPERDLSAVETIVSMVREMGMEQQVEYISFSLPVCRELIRLSPQSSVFCLNGTSSPAELKKMGIAGIDYQFKVLQEKPEWIREAKERGMAVNVWIVNDQQTMYDFVQQEVDYITTDKPALLKQMLAYP